MKYKELLKAENCCLFTFFESFFYWVYFVSHTLSAVNNRNWFFIGLDLLQDNDSGFYLTNEGELFKYIYTHFAVLKLPWFIWKKKNEKAIVFKRRALQANLVNFDFSIFGRCTKLNQIKKFLIVIFVSCIKANSWKYIKRTF